MNSKRLVLFFALFLLLISFVFAQGLDNTQEEIDKAAKDLEEGVNKFRDLQRPNSWVFIFSQWKETLLKNKFISGVDIFFTKINIVFIILFGMSWDLTPQMFFAFLFWIFTFFAINRYMILVTDGIKSLLYSAIAIIVIAQAGIFKYFGKWMVGMIFYKTSIIYRISFFFVAVIFVVVWFGANLGLAKYIENHKKETEDVKLKTSVKNTEEAVGALAHAKAAEYGK